MSAVDIKEEGDAGGIQQNTKIRSLIKKVSSPNSNAKVQFEKKLVESDRLRLRNLSVIVDTKESNISQVDSHGEGRMGQSPTLKATPKPGRKFAFSPKRKGSQSPASPSPKKELPASYVNGLPDLSIRSNQQFTWFKKERKSHRNQELLHLAPQPPLHKDVHPNSGALNLFFEKIKEKTLLQDFDHQLITKSRVQARETKKQAKQYKINRDKVYLNVKPPPAGSTMRDQQSHESFANVVAAPSNIDSLKVFQSDIQEAQNIDQANLDKAISMTDLQNQHQSQKTSATELNGAVEQVLFDNQEGMSLQALMKVPNSSNVLDYKVLSSRSPLEPDVSKIFQVQNIKERKRRRSSNYGGGMDPTTQPYQTPNPLENNTIITSDKKSKIQPLELQAIKAQSFLPTIALSPNQRRFSDQFGHSLNQETIDRRTKYDHFQNFKKLDMGNNMIQRKVSLSPLNEQSTSFNFGFDAKDGQQSQTINRIWPLKPEPLTTFKHRNSVGARAPFDQSNPSAFSQLNGPIKSDRFNNSSLNEYTSAKWQFLEEELNISKQIQHFIDQIKSKDHTAILNKEAVKIIKKKRQEQNDQTFIMIPKKQISENYDQITMTQHGNQSLRQSPAHSSTILSFKNNQAKQSNVSLGKTLGGKEALKGSNLMTINNKPALHSTTNKMSKKFALPKNESLMSNKNAKPINQNNQQPQRFTPALQTGVPLPFPQNYLSDDMRKTYMQKVLDVQISNSQRKSQKQNSLFGNNITQAIIEKTVGEGDTLSQSSALSDENGDQATPQSFQKGEMNQTQETIKNDPNSPNKTLNNIKQVIHINSLAINQKKESNLAIGTSEMPVVMSRGNSLDGFRNSQVTERSIPPPDADSEARSSMMAKHNFGNIIAENTITQSGVTLKNLSPEAQNRFSRKELVNVQSDHKEREGSLDSNVKKETTKRSINKSKSNSYKKSISAKNVTSDNSQKSPFVQYQQIVQNTHTLDFSKSQQLQIRNAIRDTILNNEISTTVLPNGSTIPCTLFVKLIIERIIESNLRDQQSSKNTKPSSKEQPEGKAKIPVIRQYLRLAKFVKSDLSLPYTKIVLPNEKIVHKFEDILENSSELVCLILLKDGQTFTRSQTKLQQIALDSLQQMYIHKREDDLQKELIEQKRLIEKISWMQDIQNAIQEENSRRSSAYANTEMGNSVMRIAEIADLGDISGASHLEEIQEHTNKYDTGLTHIKTKNSTGQSQIAVVKLQMTGQKAGSEHMRKEGSPTTLKGPGTNVHSKTLLSPPAMQKDEPSADYISPQTPIRMSPRDMSQQSNLEHNAPIKDKSSPQILTFNNNRIYPNINDIIKGQSSLGNQNPSETGILNSTIEINPGSTSTKPHGRQTQGTPLIDTQPTFLMSQHKNHDEMMEKLMRDEQLNLQQITDQFNGEPDKIYGRPDNIEQMQTNLISGLGIASNESRSSKSKLGINSPINFQDQSIAQERYLVFQKQLLEEQLNASIDKSINPTPSAKLAPQSNFQVPRGSCMDKRNHLKFVRKELQAIKRKFDPRRGYDYNQNLAVNQRSLLNRKRNLDEFMGNEVKDDVSNVSSMKTPQQVYIIAEQTKSRGVQLALPSPKTTKEMTVDKSATMHQKIKRILNAEDPNKPLVKVSSLSMNLQTHTASPEATNDEKDEKTGDEDPEETIDSKNKKRREDSKEKISTQARFAMVDDFPKLQMPTIRFTSIHRIKENESAHSTLKEHAQEDSPSPKKLSSQEVVNNASPASPGDQREQKNSAKLMKAIQSYVNQRDESGLREHQGAESHEILGGFLSRHSSDSKLQKKSHIPYSFHNKLGISPMEMRSSIPERFNIAGPPEGEIKSNIPAGSGHSPSMTSLPHGELLQQADDPQLNKQYYQYSKKCNQKTLKDRKEMKSSHINSLLSLQAHKIFQQVDSQFF